LTRLKFKGKEIKETGLTTAYETGDNLLSLTSEVVSDTTWAGKLAQWRLEESTGVENLSISLPDFIFTLDLGDKIIYDSDRYIIQTINLTNSTIKLTCKKDRTAAFSYDSGNVAFVYDDNSDATDDTDNDFDISGDGAEPNSYRFIDANCSATLDDRQRYAVLEWEPVSTASQDIKSFHILYWDTILDTAAELEEAVSLVGATYIPNSGVTTKTVDGTVFKTEIEINNNSRMDILPIR